MDADLIALRIKVTGGKAGAAETKLVRDETGRLRDEQGRFVKSTEQSSKQTEKSTKRTTRSMASLAKTATSLRTVGRGLTTYVTAPVVGIGVAAGVMSLDFDRSMRNVNSIAQLPEKRFDSLKEKVLDLAGPTAQAPKTLAEGMYDLVSSGFNAAESVVVLRKSALAASAGLTTTEVSTKAVAASLNAYHLPARRAGQVSDTLFETVNRGVLTFDELASTIGDTLPFAAQLHVNLGEVGSALSTMTKQGLSSAEAVTRTKNVLVTLIKPGKDLSSALKDVGMSGEELVAKQGLQGALETIVGTTKGKKDEIAALFPNIRALGGVLSLVGQNAKFANEDLAAFGTTSGATAKVLKEQEKSVGFKFQRAWAELSKTLIELGDTLLPVVVPFMLDLAHGAAAVAHWFAALPDPVQQSLMGLTALVALAGPMLLFASAVLRAATNLGILKATESGGLALNKGGLARGAAGIAGVGAIAAGQSGVGGDVGKAIGNIGGGALVGTSIMPGWGTAAGAGLGALVTAAPAIIDLFKADPTPFQRKVERASEALKGEHEALKGLTGSEKKWQSAQARHHNTLHAYAQAQRHLTHVLAASGIQSHAATVASYELARAERHDAKAAHAAAAAHRLHGREAKVARLKIREAIVTNRNLIPGLRHIVSELRKRANQEPYNLRLQERTLEREKELGRAVAGVKKAHAQAVQLGGKPWAKSLMALTTLQREYGLKGKVLSDRLAEQRSRLHGLAEAGEKQTPMWTELRSQINQTRTALERFNEATRDPVGVDLGKGKGGHPGHNAQGTNFWRGGLSLVGERGPELIDLPRGSRVIPAPRTREMLEAPRAAQLARAGRQGDTRYIVTVPVKLGKKPLTEVVVEAQEDARARL